MYDIYTQLALRDQLIKQALYNQLVQEALIKYAQEGAGSKNVINNPNFWRVVSGMALGVPGNMLYRTFAPRNVPNPPKPLVPNTGTGQPGPISDSIRSNKLTPSKAIMGALLGPIGAYAYRAGWL
jgi:hypothetical protein